jgi:hypothetical protein
MIKYPRLEITILYLFPREIVLSLIFLQSFHFYITAPPDYGPDQSKSPARSGGPGNIPAPSPGHPAPPWARPFGSQFVRSAFVFLGQPHVVGERLLGARPLGGQLAFEGFNVAF